MQTNMARDDRAQVTALRSHSDTSPAGRPTEAVSDRPATITTSDFPLEAVRAAMVESAGRLAPQSSIAEPSAGDAALYLAAAESVEIVDLNVEVDTVQVDQQQATAEMRGRAEVSFGSRMPVEAAETRAWPIVVIEKPGS